MHQGIISNSVSLIRIKNHKVHKSFEIVPPIGIVNNDDNKTGIQLSSQSDWNVYGI